MDVNSVHQKLLVQPVLKDISLTSLNYSVKVVHSTVLLVIKVETA